MNKGGKKHHRRRTYQHFLGLTSITLVLVLLTFPTLREDKYECKSNAVYNQNTFSWQVGDNYTITDLVNDRQDIYSEIVGITTFHGYNVFNHSSIQNFNYNVGNWNVSFVSENCYYSNDTLDYIGKDSESKFTSNIEGYYNHTMRSSTYILTNLILQDYTKGVQTWNLTYNVVNTFQYDPGKDILGTNPLSSTGKVSLIMSANIDSETITTSAGTFECWKMTDYRSDLSISNATSFYDDGDLSSYLNNYYNHTTINETHTLIEFWIDNNGSIFEGNYTTRQNNRTSFLSKSLGITVRDCTYEYDEDNRTWILTTGFELESINTQHPLNPITSEESPFGMQPIGIFLILVGATIIRRNLRKRKS